MAPDQRGSSRSRHGVWGHWVPLVLTLTVATAGVAAWAWSQRKDADNDNDHDEPGLDYDNADYGDNPAYGSSRDYRPPQGPGGPVQLNDDSYSQGVQTQGDPSQPGWSARMSGALRRTPSPQQLFDSAGKTVAAGAAAAGAVMGKALASIREEDQRNPWSEEADAKKDRSAPTSGKRRRTVVIIVSADTQAADTDEDGFHEHAVSPVMHLDGIFILTLSQVHTFSYPSTKRLFRDKALRPHLRTRPQRCLK